MYLASSFAYEVANILFVIIQKLPTSAPLLKGKILMIYSCLNDCPQWYVVIFQDTDTILGTPFEIFLRFRTTWCVFSFGSCLVVLKKTPENDPPRCFSISPPQVTFWFDDFPFSQRWGTDEPFLGRNVGGPLMFITGDIFVVLVFFREFVCCDFTSFYSPKNPGLSWDILRMGLEPLIPL